MTLNIYQKVNEEVEALLIKRLGLIQEDAENLVLVARHQMNNEFKDDEFQQAKKDVYMKCLDIHFKSK